MSDDVDDSEPPVLIKHYLVESILILACCCTPIGIIGLIYGAQVQARLAEEEYEQARIASEKARKWFKIGLYIGIVANLLSVILLIWVLSTGTSLFPTQP